MRQIYWVDGYNLLFYLDETKDLEKGREKLLESLNSLIKQAKLEIVIVFDGSKEFRKTHFEDLEIIYTPPGLTADQFILDELEMRSRRGFQFFVVSNDRHLGLSAKLLRAEVLKVSQFLKLLLKKQSKKGAPSTQTSIKISIKDREFERFLKIFEDRFKMYEADDPPNND